MHWPPIGLVKKGDEVILHGSLLVHIEAKLPDHGFELITCFIHVSILPQICPVVKGITRDFFSIYFIGFWRAEEIVTKVPDQNGINGADKNIGIGKPCSNRLIIPTGMLHANFGFTIKASNFLNQAIDSRLSVRNVTGRHKDDIAGASDRDRAFAFGDINTNCVHKGISFKWICNGQYQFSHCRFNLLGCHTNVEGFNLCKTNAANERLVGSLFYGR